MKPIKIQLRDGFAPVVVELHRPSIQVRLQTGPAQDTAIRSEIWLCNRERFVGLTLDESLSSREIKQLAKQYRRFRPPVIQLGRPIMAIQIIELGEGWPFDDQRNPVSMFCCLPASEWVTAALPAPVESHHPLLQQPANTLWLMDRNVCSTPLAVSHDAIAKIEQQGKRLLVTINPEARLELLGYAVLHLSKVETATGLAADLVAGRVRLLRGGGEVTEMYLFPHAAACRGTKPPMRGYVEQQILTGCNAGGLKEGLVFAASRTRPQDLQAAVEEAWRQ